MTNFIKLDEAIDWAERSHNLGAVVGWGMWENGKVDGLIWDQGLYIAEEDCGTACCIAGWAALKDGWTGGALVKKGDRVEYPSVVAMEVLELSDQYSSYWHILFSEANNIEDLKRIRDDLAVAEGVPTKWRR